MRISSCSRRAQRDQARHCRKQDVTEGERAVGRVDAGEGASAEARSGKPQIGNVIGEAQFGGETESEVAFGLLAVVGRGTAEGVCRSAGERCDVLGVEIGGEIAAFGASARVAVGAPAGEK